VVDKLSPDDWTQLRRKFVKDRGPMSIKNDIVRVRIEVNYGQNVGLLEKRGEERYSEQFSAPSAS
jgi:hypothetical protein